MELIQAMANLNKTCWSKNWSKVCEILRLDGSLSAEKRESVGNRFNTDPTAKMLCADSFKACEGASLVGASWAVMLDVLWNPVLTRQAIGGVFRMGQQKKVVVYCFGAAGTYKERKVH